MQSLGIALSADDLSFGSFGEADSASSHDDDDAVQPLPAPFALGTSPCLRGSSRRGSTSTAASSARSVSFCFRDDVSTDRAVMHRL